jgi:hypothetical protein
MKSTKSSAGFSFLFLLEFVFIVLKLLGAVTWSWWLVFVPAGVSLSIDVLRASLLLATRRPFGAKR